MSNVTEGTVASFDRPRRQSMTSSKMSIRALAGDEGSVALEVFAWRRRVRSPLVICPNAISHYFSRRGLERKYELKKFLFFRLRRCWPRRGYAFGPSSLLNGRGFPCKPSSSAAATIEADAVEFRVDPLGPSGARTISSFLLVVPASKASTSMGAHFRNRLGTSSWVTRTKKRIPHEQAMEEIRLYVEELVASVAGAGR